ncbi:MAG: queuosine precursor transporter [Promethearchaeota archaeon]
MLEGLIVSIGIFILLGFVTYIGAWYTANLDSPRALIGIYILFLTLAQFFAAKIAEFDLGLQYIPFLGSVLNNLGFLPIFAPVGVIVFPFTLQITDMVNERFGRKAVYEMIWIAFISQIIMVVLLVLAGFLPAEDDPLDPFSIVPAITLASWISFLISERFDAWIYDGIRSWINKRIDEGRDWWKYLWIRNVFSDILSLGLDSIIFIPLAFLIFPSIQIIFDPSIQVITLNFMFILIIGQLITKWFLGLIDTPFMYLTRWIYEKKPQM